jgi:hypothetical protein
MRSTTLRIAVAAISSALVLGAGATAASAAPAAFSSTGAISTSLVGSLVFKVGTTPIPATTITCTRSGFSPTGTVTNTGVPAQGKVTSFALSGLSCVSGSGQSAGVYAAENNSMNFPMLANKTGSAYSLSGTGDWHLSLYAGFGMWDSIPVYSPAGYTASWINYPTAPFSKLVFSNAPIGHVTGSPGATMVGQPITLTATFMVNQGGSQITLS